MRRAGTLALRGGNRPETDGALAGSGTTLSFGDGCRILRQGGGVGFRFRLPLLLTAGRGKIDIRQEVGV